MLGVVMRLPLPRAVRVAVLRVVEVRVDHVVDVLGVGVLDEVMGPACDEDVVRDRVAAGVELDQELRPVFVSTTVLLTIVQSSARPRLRS